jgi:putative ubiquitin-RnfH superfamily antitoxin RatB of RatAB toxin-antitoxin module
MNVTVVWATAGVQDIVEVALSQGATVADAVAQSRILETYALDATQLRFAVFGRRAAAEAPLRDGDRVEITRPLQADPKEARRSRARVASKMKDPRSR